MTGVMDLIDMGFIYEGELNFLPLYILTRRKKENIIIRKIVNDLNTLEKWITVNSLRVSDCLFCNYEINCCKYAK